MGPEVQPKCFRHEKHMRNNWKLRKRGYLIRFSHTEALLFKKKRTLNGHFSRPAETDPYVLYMCTFIRTLKIRNLGCVRHWNLYQLLIVSRGYFWLADSWLKRNFPDFHLKDICKVWYADIILSNEIPDNTKYQSNIHVDWNVLAVQGG